MLLIVRSDYINNDTISHILWSLTPPNKLVCELALATGWRIDDCLAITTCQLKRASESKRHLIKISEKKSGKVSRRYISTDLCNRMLAQAGRIYVFEGRDDYRKHRSRQAVYLDLKKSAKCFNIKLNLSPHSLRKNYAVDLYHDCGNIEKVREALNHDNIIVTMIYALADELAGKYDIKCRHKK